MGVVFLVVSGFLSARFINRFGLKPILISGMILRARDHKLYLKNDNLLVSVILQLGEFENAFENLLYFHAKIMKNYHLWMMQLSYHFCNVSIFLIEYQMCIQHMQ